MTVVQDLAVFIRTEVTVQHVTIIWELRGVHQAAHYRDRNKTARLTLTTQLQMAGRLRNLQPRLIEPFPCVLFGLLEFDPCSLRQHWCTWFNQGTMLHTYESVPE